MLAAAAVVPSLICVSSLRCYYLRPPPLPPISPFFIADFWLQCRHALHDVAPALHAETLFPTPKRLFEHGWEMKQELNVMLTFDNVD